MIFWVFVHSRRAKILTFAKAYRNELPSFQLQSVHLYQQIDKIE
jgi:hypothetical protein